MGVKPPISDLAGQDFDFDFNGEVESVKVPSKHGMWAWAKVQKIFGRVDHGVPSRQSPAREVAFERDGLQQPPVRPVGIGLPRQTTFKRQNSEQRDRLLPVHQCLSERRAVSSSRHTSLNPFRLRSNSSPPPSNPARVSAPAVQQHSVLDDRHKQNDDLSHCDAQSGPSQAPDEPHEDQVRPPRPASRTSSDDSLDARSVDADDKAQLNAELDSKWILNLSMHFRDKSDREKFFVTYAQQPNRWRRVTISCDYRDAEHGSLEMDLKELQYQRDKSLQIYESIRDSLPDIQFYDTVTNLKLETRNGRLHVHVTEDVNEIIPYPQRRSVSHILENSDSPIPPMEVRECDLEFDSHLSGFVYKVRYGGIDYIKKEIPGPDTVDEFLYEVNALHDLHDTDYVIRLEAIVVDDTRQLVKGLLISFAERGALVDLLYDCKGQLAWEDRVRWAEQAVRGLSQIHEEGYVQGDFTLSNIVVDGANDAKIIDINRRGCPVGWEPPEIARKIASNQRISMYIGEKSDIYQLGMTLWALAMDDDEPERHDPPLSVDDFPVEVPDWYRNVVRICLAPKPRDRLSATDLVRHFPPIAHRQPSVMFETRPSLSLRTNSKQYIDPATAVERDDIQRYRHDPLEEEDLAWTPASSYNNQSYTYPRSSNYEAESGSSYMERQRGRSPPASSFHGDRGLSELPRSRGEDLSPLEIDDRQLHIVTPLADRDFYDYVSEAHDQPSWIVLQEPEHPEEIPEDQTDTPVCATGAHYETSAVPEMIATSREVDPAVPNDIELDPPTPAKATSLTSESTPRNAHSVMGGSAATLPPAPRLDLATADLAGFGGHPSLEDQSPHEPKTMVTPENGTPALAGCAPPPRLPFDDSGYGEALALEGGQNPTLTAMKEADVTDNAHHTIVGPEHRSAEQDVIPVDSTESHPAEQGTPPIDGSTNQPTEQNVHSPPHESTASLEAQHTPPTHPANKP
jgi:serine/threonine protein kinase